jgi:hypothetical protein
MDLMTTLELMADVRIDRPVGEVKAFFADIDNLVRWDRGVIKVVRPMSNALGPGVEFSTLGPAAPGRRGKVSVYRITKVSDDHATVALINDRILEKAEWTMRFAATPAGETDVHCTVVASARPRYFFVVWLLRLLRQSIVDDLYYLKRAIENGEIAKQ